MTGGFYLGTCSQEKVCRHDMKDVSPAMMKGFFIVFVNVVFRAFYRFIASGSKDQT